MSMKNSNDTIGNRNRDLSVCNAVPQPTALMKSIEFLWIRKRVKDIERKFPWGIAC